MVSVRCRSFAAGTEQVPRESFWSLRRTVEMQRATHPLSHRSRGGGNRKLNSVLQSLFDRILFPRTVDRKGYVIW